VFADRGLRMTWDGFAGRALRIWCFGLKTPNTTRRPSKITIGCRGSQQQSD
jgi:hypothetical protein